MARTTPVLRITLSGIAALARVQRPVVSMWRSRSAAGAEPFPAPIATDRGQELFDAGEVAHWLIDTRHGNNPDAQADAAAHASIAGIEPGDTDSFNALTALVALRAAHGAPIGALDADALRGLAARVDPTDGSLAGEITALAELEEFAGFVDVLVDGAYTPHAAFETVMAARFRDGHRDLARTALDPVAVGLVASAALELAVTNPHGLPEAPVIVDPTGVSSDLLIGVVEAAGEDRDLTVVTADHAADTARLLRRRLIAHGVLRDGFAVHESGEFALTGPVVHVGQYPSPAGPNPTAVEVLSAIESVVLQMDDAQRGVVIAPASVLSDGRLPAAAAQLRSDVLRSGRVRAIVRLPAGLLASHPRRAMALWVLGPAHETVPLADRWTVVADLTTHALTRDVVADLISDLVAAMGDRLTVRAHAFRFARPVATSSLLASTGSLIVRDTAVQHGPVRQADAATRARTAVEVDDILAETGTEFTDHTVAPATRGALPGVSLGALVTERHLRYVAGTRIATADIAGADGFTVIGVVELCGDREIGARTIDRLDFAAQYPSARLTEPGDIIFCTGRTPRAIIDHAGSSVVAYPARVLRISRADSAGLVPDVLAADISAAAGSDWKRWTARRVAPEQRMPLQALLADIRRERQATLARLTRLDNLAALVTQGVTAGALCVQSKPPSIE